MSTIQIRLESNEQLEKLLHFLRKMRLDFSVQTDDVFSAAALADADPHDAYKAAQPILADDWDCPEDAHWDKL